MVGFKLNLDSILGNFFKNPARVRAGVIRSMAKPWCQNNIWPILNELGEKDLRFIIENDKPIHKYIPDNWKSMLKHPEIRKYAWMLAGLTGDDYLSLLPPWVVELILESDHNKEYLAKEIQWLYWQLTDQGENPWPETTTVAPEKRGRSWVAVPPPQA